MEAQATGTTTEGSLICLDNDKDEDKASDGIENDNKDGEITRDCNLLGRVVHNEMEAFKLYNDYAYSVGFGVRCGKQRLYERTTLIRQKEYVCRNEGQKGSWKLGEEVNRRLTTRCNCLAMIRFSVSKDGSIWKVTKHVKEHNHELAKPEERHLIRSFREVTKEKAVVIDKLIASGANVKTAYEIMIRECGGTESVGFTIRDCYNYVNNQKKKFIDAEDAQSLIDMFRRKKNQDIGFFYTFQVDQEGKLTNIFWRDGQSMVDYDAFGDVVIFDTTYRTNKYDLICAPFVGLNHHRQNVMFGCSFMLDEKTESFTWLFKSFREAMGNKSPKTIFTDQDQAMANAITVIFPEARHRLCQWHIFKKTSSHLGKLHCNHKFMSSFYRCFHGVDSKEEFEYTWHKMINDFDCKGNSWLDGLYKIRHKWSAGLNNDTFSAGLLSTQRSESTNNVLNDLSTATTTLTHFVMKFDVLVERWRKTEFDESYRCKQGVPYLEVNSGLMRHSATVYTNVMFKIFKAEYLTILAMRWIQMSCSGDVCTYEVKAERDNAKSYLVAFKKENLDVSCSCKFFEAEGILCSHALKILSLHNVTMIPEKYVLLRWTKQPKQVISYSWLSETSSEPYNGNSNEPEIIFRNSRARSSYNMILQCATDARARKEYDVAFEQLVSRLNNVLAGMDLHGDVNEGQVSRERHEKYIKEVSIKNPPKARPKGAPNVRFKSHLEKSKRKLKKTKIDQCSKETSLFFQPSSVILPMQDSTSMVPITTPMLLNSMDIPTPRNNIPSSFTFAHQSMMPMTPMAQSHDWNFGHSTFPFTSMMQGVPSIPRISSQEAPLSGLN